jgi:hypothetical protein
LGEAEKEDPRLKKKIYILFFRGGGEEKKIFVLESSKMTRFWITCFVW